MLRAILYSAVIVFCLPGSSFAQEWTEWFHTATEDPLTDRVTQVVKAQENQYSPAFVYLACNTEHTLIAFSDGRALFHRGNPRVSVRFDDGEVLDMGITNDLRNPRFFVHTDRMVARFAEGLRSSSRLVFRIDQGRTHSLPLTGAAEALAQLEAECELPVDKPLN